MSLIKPLSLYIDKGVDLCFNNLCDKLNLFYIDIIIANIISFFFRYV